MRLALAASALAACSSVDLASRPTWPTRPLCLIVNETPDSWKREHVFVAAEEWNERLGADLVHVMPECKIGDEWVVLSFLREISDYCASNLGCASSRASVNGRPGFREVVIHERAPLDTVIHEIGHLVGCRHNDLDPPCQKGILP